MFAKRERVSKKNKRKREGGDPSDVEASKASNNDDASLAYEREVEERNEEDTRERLQHYNQTLEKNKKGLNSFSTSGASRKSKEWIETTRTIESTREILPQKYAGDATYESQIDTERDRDARAVLERNIQMNNDGTAENTKLYKGQAGYKNYVEKSEAQIGMNKYTGTQGPIRAQTWARSICRFDYQPDICKDYKETGFCGFGDSCIFLHDRGDYKSGWQIEKEFQEKQLKKQQRLVDGGEADKDEDEVDNEYFIGSDSEEQFACTICRNPFRNAVKTLCGHFFCEACALKHYKKSLRCFNCGKQTNGVFNVDEKLRAKEKQLRAEDEKESDVGEEDEAEEIQKVHNVVPSVIAKSKGRWTVVE